MKKLIPKVNPALKAAWAGMDHKQRERFSRLSGKSLGSMVQYVYGRRGINSETAVRMERAALRLGFELSRTQLNDTCRRCEFAAACLGSQLANRR